jgi:hypothetical protein
MCDHVLSFSLPLYYIYIASASLCVGLRIQNGVLYVVLVPVHLAFEDVFHILDKHMNLVGVRVAVARARS